MAGGRRDLRVPARRFQSENRVIGRIAGVDQVVRCPRMARIALEHVHRDGRRLHRPLDVGAVAGIRVERERVEERDLVVFRKLFVQLRQTLHPCGVIFFVQGARGFDEALFGRRELGVGRNLRQRGLGGRRVLLAPERMVVGHRLAPVRDRARRRGLRLHERVAGVFVDERMQIEHAFQRLALADFRPGGGEVRDAEVRCKQEGEHAVSLIPLDRGGRTRYGGGMKTLTRSRLWRGDSLRRTSR